MKFREIEFKYRAQVGLSTFRTVCANFAPETPVFIQASGFDRFYDSSKEPGSFARHRVEPGKFNQLSFKRKHAEKNNYVRTEHNITLALDTREDQIRALCAEFGYTYNCSLFKNCFIYRFPLYTLVYYVCFDENMKELDRFIEIELEEDHDWGSEALAMEALQRLEGGLSELLGISPQARIKRSLFEMFRKESK